MANVLILSSQVVRGYIGGSATRVVLETLGHEAWLIPTILLSNHPAHEHFSGQAVPPEQIRKIMLSLDANAWLTEIDAIVTGYMPTPAHAHEAQQAIMMVQAEAPWVPVYCDPIMGDDPGGLYIGEDTADAMAEKILPLAEVITPNRFELERLSGKPVTSIHDAITAARSLGDKVTLATSVPGESASDIHDMIIFSDRAFHAGHMRRESAPHGTGDLMAALYVGHVLNKYRGDTAFARAAGALETMLDIHRSRDFALPQTRARWAEANPVRIEEVFPPS